ncbi:MAG: hypothetical protein IPI01_20810 [Ignavibacteriae bacterium]|nr:hypothetical protein [Ignavibacteriota bacterium]
MVRSCLAAAVLILMLCPLSGNSQTHKYGIKSGSVTFETETVMGKIKMNEHYVVWFDDYGTKEAKETMENGAVTGSFFSDGVSLYTVKTAKRTAFKSGNASRGTEYRFDWGEVPAKDKQAGKAKQLPARTIAGKECQSYEVTSGSVVSTFAGWQGVTLFHELKRENMTVTTRAVKFDEKVAVPAAKFAVPAGFTVK